jgi:hypothetical protein
MLWPVRIAPLWTSVTTIFAWSSSSSSASIRGSSSRSSSISRPLLHHPLSQVYADLAQRTNQLETWPDSKAFCEQCLVPRTILPTNTKSSDDDPHTSIRVSSTTTTTTVYTLPEFTDGHGPVGIFALLHNNDIARSILKLCDEAFDEFCHDVCNDILRLGTDNSNNNEQQQQRNAMKENWILQTLPTSHHITVAMIQEHPQFLRGGNKDDLKKWRPLSNTFLLELSDKLRHYHQTVFFSSSSNNEISSPSSLPPPPPQMELQLDSVLWTPDGAMIAGFIDKNESSLSSSFQQLRESSLDIVRREMGGDLMTSRPKNLIHVTLGRIVGLPPPPPPGERPMTSTKTTVTQSQQQKEQSKALTELCRRYNTEYLPTLVDSIQKHHATGGCFPLSHLSVARNKIWMMQDYMEYATWPLIGTNTTLSN